MLDKTTPIPLYYQIKEDIRRQIESGELKPEMKLPTESWLISHYGVSRVTIRNALAELISAGCIENRRGKGNYVTNPRVVLPFGQLTSLHKVLTNAGIKSTSRILDSHREGANSKIASHMNVPEGEPLLVIHRIRMADDNPISDQLTYLREKFCKGLDAKALQTRSLYETLETQYGVNISHSAQTIGAVLASKKEMANLQLPQSIALLSVQATVYNTDGEAIEYSENHYVPDRYKYSITLHYHRDQQA